MGVPTSEVCYIPAMTRREDHEVHKGRVVALEGGEVHGFLVNIVVTLCYVVMLFYVVFCYVIDMLCYYVTVCCVMLSYVMFCYCYVIYVIVMLCCYVMLCYVILSERLLT